MKYFVIEASSVSNGAIAKAITERIQEMKH